MDIETEAPADDVEATDAIEDEDQVAHAGGVSSNYPTAC